MKRVIFLAILGLIMACSSEKGNKSKNLSAKVDMQKGRPTLFINDSAVYPMLYALPDQRTGRWTWNELPQHNIQLFANKAGIKLVQADIFLDHIWMPDGSINLDTAKMQVRGILEVCPNAAVMLRLHVNAPRWWQKKNSEEGIQYANIDSTIKDYSIGFVSLLSNDVLNVQRFSFASEKWKKEAGAMTAKFCKEFAKTTEGGSVFSIQVASGVYGEWHYFGFLDNDPDVSPSMTSYFRKWLKNKYKNIESLQQSWGNSSISFDNAQVPNTIERNTLSQNFFRDPVKERNVIDYFEAQHQVLAEAILHFSKTVKDNWPRPIVTGAFYGYFFSLFTRDAAGGHLAIDTVLKSPYIDFLCGPQAYYPQANLLGDPYHSRGLLTSLRLNEKLWIDEMDQEPPLLNKTDSNYQKSIRESIAMVRRNVLYTFCQGMGLWFYDFGLQGISWEDYIPKPAPWALTHGWWQQDEILEDLRKLKVLLEEKNKQSYQSDADVLMVFDTKSFFYTTSETKRNTIANVAVNWNLVNVFRNSYVPDLIYLNDLDKINLDQYKAVIFNNTFLLTSTQKEFIKTKVAANNRTLIWFYAPGYTDGKSNDDKYISEITGINIEKTDHTDTKISFGKNYFDIQQPPHEQIYGILPNYIYSDNKPVVSPLFTINDAQAIILGKYSKSGKPAIAIKKNPTFTSLYVAMPAYEPQLMGEVLNLTGAHQYSKSNDIFYAGNGILMMHTKNGGKKSITLKNGKTIVCSLPDEASTLIIDSETGEILLK